MTKMTRLSFPVLAAAAALAILAGCGSDDGGSGDGPASVAPADTQVFVEAKIQPTGELKTNLEEIAQRVAGVDDLGETVVSYLEQAALNSEEPLDFEKEVQPWLGESAGIFLTGYNGDDFEPGGFAIEVTDTGEAQDFIDKQVDSENEKVTDESYEGIDYKLGSSDEDAVGIIGDFVVFGDGKAAFEEAVDASKDESLTDVDNYTSLTPSSPQSSLANVYVDIAGLIKSVGSEVDPQALKLFESAGLELENSAALASLVPGQDNVEIDLSTKLGEAEGKVSTATDTKLLGSLPSGALAAISVGDLGESLGEIVDTVDKEGIPGEVPAGKLKSTLKEAGIDVDQIAGNLGDAAAYVQGANRATLGGALVIEAKDADEATNTVSNVGTLLRASGTPGVTALGGDAAGFSIRSSELGAQPLVIAAKGDRLAIGYGTEPTLRVLAAKGGGEELSKTKAYNEALNSLGGTPITGFAAGGPVVRLIEGVVSSDERQELEEARPYLSKIPFLAVGTETKDEVVQSKIVLGVTK